MTNEYMLTKEDKNIVADFYKEIYKITEKIGDYCKELRKSKNLSRKEFAKKAGLSVQTIFNFENNRVCKVEYMLLYKHLLCESEKENDDFIMMLVDCNMQNKYLRGNKTLEEHKKEITETFK